MDIALLESFALAEDRPEALRRIIPGTDEHSFLQTLLWQQQGRLREAREGAEQARSHRGSLLLRQRLLDASTDEGWAALSRDFSFEHRCNLPGKKTPLPSRAPASLATTRAVTLRAQASGPSGLNALSQSGLCGLLASGELPPKVRHGALSRLSLPVARGLVDLLLADLGGKPEKGFGGLDIHKNLTLEQMDELAQKAPSALQSGDFVASYLRLLDLDPRGGDEAQRLDRKIGFVEGIPSSKGVLQELLARRVELRLARGVVDREGLVRCLSLVRRPADSKGLDSLDGVPREASMRAALLACLAEGPDELRGALSERFLRKSEAEARLLAGDPDAERWASRLDGAELRALRDRVDLELAPGNPVQLGVDDPVMLRLDVKNVDALVIRIFHIDPVSYFRSSGGPPPVDIDLDGLVPGAERVLRFELPPVVRHRVVVEVPEARGPGTYVIDLVGGGLSCRALLRKGSLRALRRVGAAGDVLTVLDERDRPVPGASVWLGDRVFEADAGGEAVLPFAASSSRRAVMLSHEGRTGFEQLFSESEAYALDASFHVEREDLIPGAEARVLVRARLLASGGLASLSLVERLRAVVIASHRNVSSERSYSDLRLDEQGELLLTFTVPEGLDALKMVLMGDVLTTQGARCVVHAFGHLSLDGQRGSQRVASLFLTHEPGGWGLLALGRAGEPVAGVEVALSLWHHASGAPLGVSLQTDERGAIALGPLAGVTALQASEGGVSQRWELATFACTYPGELHLSEGEGLALPVGDVPEDAPAAALFESSGSRLIRDRSSALTVTGRELTIAPLEAGEYTLALFAPNLLQIRLLVSAGARRGGYHVERGRRLRPAPRPPARLDVAVDEGGLQIQARGASRRARVHVFASTLAHPMPSLRQSFLAQGGVEAVADDGCVYAAARVLGDEARYILARRHAERRAGNMLPRPGLLLSPWAVADTSTGAEQLRAPGAYASAGPGGGGAGSYASEDLMREGGPSEPGLDFLRRPAVVLASLALDAEGKARVPLEALEGRGSVRVLLVDGDTHVARRVAAAPVELALRELRVKAPPSGPPQALRAEASTLAAGGQLPLSGGRYRVYDSIAQVGSLLESLDPSRRCTRFEFLASWPSLDEEQKQKHYSDSACCELNYFLFRKDRPFFERVIRPHLACKRQRVFLDDYLLDADLSRYRALAERQRLNGLERVLLAERLGELDLEAQAMRDQIEALGADPGTNARLFQAALQAGALSEAPSLPEEAEPPPRGGRPRPAAMAKKASPKMAKGASRARLVAAEEESADDDEAGDLDDAFDAPAEEQKLDRDIDRRAATRALYRPLDVTREHAEQHYFEVRLRDMGEHLAPVNPFWRDLASHRGPGPFLSPNVLFCTDGQAAMLLALASLDLPFSAPAPSVRQGPDGPLLVVSGPALIFAEHTRLLEAPTEPSMVVAQHYFDGDNQPLESQSELLVGKPYRCRVSFSNPTHQRRAIEVRASLPEGSIPLGDSAAARVERLVLSPFETRSFEQLFYFPHPGSFRHALALVSDGQAALTAPSIRPIEAALEPSSVDTSAWQHLSQAGHDDEVIEALSTRNLHTIDLDLMAFRLHDRAFYERAIGVLERRRFYHHTTWTYAFLHRDLARAAELLRVEDHELRGALLRVDAPWLAHDPHDLGLYEHLEYTPLVNARAHGPAGGRKILNSRLAEQVERLLVYLCSKPALDDDDQLSVVYYLLLQDRLEEATARFARVDPARIRAQLQYDYARAYLAFVDAPALARDIALRHAAYPVDRWRDRFREILAQLDEIEGHPAATPDPTEREQRQGQLASTQPSVELLSSADGLVLRHRNAPRCELRFYEMDLELLFSQRPFALQTFRGRPPLVAGSQVAVEPGPGEGSVRVEIPAPLRGKPLLVEASCGEARATVAHTTGSLSVQTQEAYGQLRVLDASTFAPLPRVYVKVYAQDSSGRERFHKDGYTDPRGRFDYASVSDGNAAPPRRFSMLLLCDQRGAVIREVNAPTS